VYRSNRHIYAQLIDDRSAATIAQASDSEVKAEGKTARAKAVGELSAQRARDAGIGRVRRQLERRALAVQQREALADVREPHPLSRRRPLAQPRAGVADRELDAAVRPPRHRDVDAASLRRGLDAVLDGVLDQRLQQHRRQQALSGPFADAVFESQSRTEAHLFDREKGLHQRDLLI